MRCKVAVSGGGGVRTPLLIHGLAQSSVDVSELALYDVDLPRAEWIASLGRELAAFPITVHSRLEPAVEGAAFVFSSLRVGGIAARRRDERIALEHGLAGQETTGPAGFAMALRTIPVALAQARLIEKLAPAAWLINFTNPAGLITEAVLGHAGVRAIGICDTPSELFHRIGEVIGDPACECDYAGLNHLGWVRQVRSRGMDVTARLLNDETALAKLYPADLFDPSLVRTLGLIPSEYLFFYYSQRRAYANQMRAGATRGGEIERMNAELFERLKGQEPGDGIATYRAYLAQRNASYLRLEAEAGSAYKAPPSEADPFETATGYHRIATSVMEALTRDQPRRIVLNVPNHGAIRDLPPDAVVEVPCMVSRSGATPIAVEALPESVRGLVLSVKAYERLTIRAALEGSRTLARLAMLQDPIIGDWELAGELLNALAANDEHLSYLS